MSMIVVGVDGSDESKAALGWALKEARLRSATVRCVHAWALPSLVVGMGYEPLLDASYLASLRQDAEAMIDRTLAEVGGAGEIEVNRVVLEGPPAQMLVDAAKDADLLVVGSRGHSGLTGLLLGSVSHQCAQHAPCPIVIVRHSPAG
jgi:nucleotide-binding universal stress UspA family protein